MGFRVDLVNEYISGVSVAPQVVTADVNGSGVDCQDGGPEVHLVALSTDIESEEDTTITWELEESSDNSTFSNMTQADGSTAEAAAALAAGDTGLKVFTSYRRTLRYVRAVCNVAGTSVSETVAAAILCRKISY